MWVLCVDVIGWWIVFGVELILGIVASVESQGMGIDGSTYTLRGTCLILCIAGLQTLCRSIV